MRPLQSQRPRRLDLPRQNETMIPTSIYLAGPMRGIPQFNFPSFHAARQRLRDAGWRVQCPAERDVALGFDPTGLLGTEDLDAVGFNLPGALEQCFRDVLDVDAVALLPGWTRSEGARAEALIAILTERAVFQFFQHRPAMLEPLTDVSVLTRVEAIR